MLSREAIKKTTICYWSDEDEAFIAESTIFPRTAGFGATKREALAHFGVMLDELWDDLKTGKVQGYDKVGRPRKNGVRFDALIKPATKILIAKRAKELGISQGELLDYLVKSAASQNKPRKMA